MKRVHAARSALSLYVIGYLLIVAAMAYGFWLIQHQADVETYLRCHESNNARQAIVRGFDAYTGALIAASNADDDDPPANPERRARQIDLFKQEVAERLAPLKPVDCGPRP